MDEHHYSDNNTSFAPGFVPSHPQPNDFPTAKDFGRSDSASAVVTSATASANNRATITSSAAAATRPTTVEYLYTLANRRVDEQLLMQTSLPPFSQLLPRQPLSHAPELAMATSTATDATNATPKAEEHVHPAFSAAQATTQAAVAESSKVVVLSSTMYYDYAVAAAAATHHQQMEAAMNEAAVAVAGYHQATAVAAAPARVPTFGDAAGAGSDASASDSARVAAAVGDGDGDGDRNVGDGGTSCGGGSQSIDSNIHAAVASGDIMPVEIEARNARSSNICRGPPASTGNRRRYESISGGTLDKVYSFVAIPGNNAKKRPRRRHDEIERLYKCNWPGCSKAYGTLNHLNAHVTMQNHGPKRHPTEFKEMRKEWRRQRKEREGSTPVAGNIVHQDQQQSRNYHHHLHQTPDPSPLPMTFESTGYNFCMEQPLSLNFY